MEFSPIPPNFASALETTRQLRDFYSAQVREYERLLELARSQLFHAEGLLAGLQKLQPEANCAPRRSAAIAPQQASIGNGNGNGNGHSAGNGHIQQQLSTEPKALSGNGLDNLSSMIATVLSSKTSDLSSLDSDVQLLPPYQDLPLPEAIALLLQENAGTILKLDFLVRSLYGKLPAAQVDIVTEQVKRSLEAGVEEGRWYRDSLNHPHNTDCYTWLPLEETELTPSAQSASAGLSVSDGDLDDSDNIDGESLVLPIVDGVVSEKEFMELVEKGILNFDKMKKIAQKLQFRSYGTIKSSKAFAAFFGKKSIKRSVIQPYL